jgi:pilus assembly protein FimV
VIRTTSIDMTARITGFYRVAALAVLMGWQTASSWALSVGQIRANAVLGQPLSLAIPVSHPEGEDLSAECIATDVVAGDYKVPVQVVRTRLMPGRSAGESIVRITTSAVVEEPVLTVTVTVGCANKTSRTVTLFADPPAVNLPESTMAATPAPAASQQPPVDVVAEAPPPPRVVQQPVVEPSARPVQRRVAKKPPRSSAPSLPSRASIVARPARAPASGSVASGSGKPVAPVVPAVPPLAVPAPAVAAAASAGRSTLKLEAVPPQPGASEAAGTEKATAAAQAALAAAEAASAAQARLKVLEQELASLRQQAQQQAQQFATVQSQLANVRTVADPKLAWLVPLLGGAAVVFGLTSSWLWWRGRKLQRQQAAWWDAQSQPSAQARDSSSPRDFSPSRTEVVRRPGSEDQFAPDSRQAAPISELVTDSVAPSQGLDSMMSPRTVQNVPRSSSAFGAPSSQFGGVDNAALSVDEQIDVEQQADFFIALGHDDEAIDLLMANLRSTGGASPLPYLKLLEIHRRLGQREEYERTRNRFNQRFNSVAPDWSTDPSTGRLLEQYPMVMGRIQASWTSPLDAMVELESLLFGRSEHHEVFDLPAYQEVLLLYQVARELHTSQPNAHATDDVDVLLPIGGPTEAAVSDGTIVLRPEFNAGRSMKLDLELESRPGALPDDVKVTPPAPSISRQDQQRRDDS